MTDIGPSKKHVEVHGVPRATSLECSHAESCLRGSLLKYRALFLLKYKKNNTLCPGFSWDGVNFLCSSWHGMD